jgi:hypothetical protein
VVQNVVARRKLVCVTMDESWGHFGGCDTTANGQRVVANDPLNKLHLFGGCNFNGSL